MGVQRRGQPRVLKDVVRLRDMVGEPLREDAQLWFCKAPGNHELVLIC
jgi:hypothetical protein